MTKMEDLRNHILEHLSWGPLKNEDKVRFLALALCGEAGEFANLIKKDWRGDDGIPQRRAKMIEELADVANYAFMLAEALGVDLPQAMLNKLHEVEQRPEWANAKR